MSKELVIGSNRHETKVAILEENQLVEVYFQRSNEYSLAGSIHKGRVTRVLPGMQSAFVDLGLERDTFLYVSDFFEENEEFDTLTDDKPAASGRGERGDRDRDRGRQQRPPERAREEQSVAPSDVAPAEESAEADGDDENEVVPEAASPQVQEARAPEQQLRTNGDRPTGDRPQGDRGQGDRRGRRSRRRRGHGRDFPDNKYAQPSATSPAASSAAPVERTEEPARFATAEEPEEEPLDVMVLPGESLAKYRDKPAGEEAVAPVRRGPRYYILPKATEAPVAAVPPVVAPEPVTETPAQELEAEAVELELRDRVFASHGDTPVLGEVAAEETAEETLAEEKQPERIAEPEFASFVEEGAEERSAVAGQLIEPDELQVKSAAETLPDYEDLAPEFEEAFAEASAGEEGPAGDGDAPEERPNGEAGVQTASMRDQGGQSMHRASRRMRRRRGGNRFGAQRERTAGSQVAPAGTPASAAAPAAEPEARSTEGRREEREAPETRTSERPERVMPSISELLKAGQEIIVQIAKEPLGQKGARITSHIALPGRYVVFMPSVAHLGVSRKVGSEEERQRLKRILQTHRVGTTGGFIIRTAGEGVTEEEIAADMSFLYSLWLDIRQKAEKKPAPALLHYDLGIVQRILRDQVTDEFKAIWVDNEDLYENVVTFMQRFQPGLVNRVKMYTRAAPIFDAFNITQELEKALRPKVWLKSGGYIVINQTEALVAIDINTGKYVGKSNRLEDTIVKTNIEAVKEIVRQIRLRDLGGIIVVDFIDMDERKNRQKVMQALEEAMESDKAPYKILQFNDFGLVAITRKRVKQSLERTLCAPCPHCEGAGYIKSVPTVISEILVEAQKIARAIDGKDVLLRVHTDVAKELKSSNNKYLEELEEILGRPVLVKSDATLHHEKFDLG